MITSKTVYDLYEVERKLQLEEIENELKTIIPIKIKLAKYLNTCIFQSYFTKEEEREGNIKPILNPVNNSEKLFNIQVKSHNQLRKHYNNKIKNKELIQGFKVNPNIFSFILSRFNQLLLKEIIYKGYTFTDLFLGEIKVIRANTGNAVNWGKSLKKKKELLDAGLEPYSKEGYEKALQEGIEYKGIEYIERLEEENLYFNWKIGAAQALRIPNVQNFILKPLRGDTSPVKELYDYRKTLTNEQMINQFNTK